MDEQSKRTSAVWIGLGAGVLLLALVVAGVVTVLLRDDPTATGSDRTTPSTTPPNATASTAPSLSTQDACVVGTWTESSSRSSVQLYGVTVQLAGSGAVQDFRADGTGTVRYANVVKRGTAGGHTYEVIDDATVTFAWRTANGQIVYSNVRGTGMTTWKVDGAPREGAAFKPLFTFDRYTCEADRMTQTGDGYSIELARTR